MNEAHKNTRALVYGHMQILVSLKFPELAFKVRLDLMLHAHLLASEPTVASITCSLTSFAGMKPGPLVPVTAAPETGQGG